MAATYSPMFQHDGRLWAFALALSLTLNALLVLVAGISILQLEKFRAKPELAASVPDPVHILVPEWEPAPPPAAVPATPPAADRMDFTRTSPDQAADRPAQPTHFGERDTQATSNTTPDPSAPALPAQAGIKPLHEGHIETTESRFRDGVIAPDATAAADLADQAAPPTPPSPPAPPAPPMPESAAAATAARGTDTPDPGSADEVRAPPLPERLATSPHPVDVPVAKRDLESPPQPAPPDAPRQGLPEGLPDANDLKELKPPSQLSANVKEPVFRGNQRKTTLRGSISRSGQSSLAVENTELGRYQAAISRAVELEWQRNCFKYRDLITPGFLTVSFSLDSRGKVQNVSFVGTMHTGEHQKGFTLNSIRNAPIPAMPPELGRKFKDETLELIYSFYFN